MSKADSKFVSLQQAIAKIKTGSTISTCGFVGIGTPEFLLHGLEQRFLETGTPTDIDLVFAAGQGDGQSKGLNRIAHKKLLRRVVGGHWALTPKLGKLALNGDIEAYNLPQGCLSQLLRDTAAGKPGTVSKVGLHTFVDPRIDGGKINDVCTENLVSIVSLTEEEWLFYKAIPIDVAFIRGSYADERGNISLKREALTLDNLSIAMAAKNSGGIVIAQVEGKAPSGILNSREITVPGTFVDYIVEAPSEYHQQTYATSYSSLFSGEIRTTCREPENPETGIRKIIAARAAMELPTSGVINLGIGMPEGIANIARKSGKLETLTLSTEAGSVGGIPQSGLDFGASINADTILDQSQQFDFYDGGGLSMACLGMAEVDQEGNVNVSRFGSKLAGCGGFINISQNSKKVVFVGTFTAGGLEVKFANGKLKILKEGRSHKFVPSVSQITFSGRYSQEMEQKIIYITERCVFKMTPNGLELTEIAPGIDIQADIIDHMGFAPIIRSPKQMDIKVFE